MNIRKFLSSLILKNIDLIGIDCLGLSFWRVAFKTHWLSNIAKIPVAFKPQPSLNLTLTLYFKPRFRIFIINGYHACSPWGNTLRRCLWSSLSQFSVPTRHKSRLSHVNIILRHYGGQLKTAVEQEMGKKTVKDDKKSGKEIRIWKWQVFDSI